MKNIDRKYLLQIVTEHLEKVRRLQFLDYGNAEFLYLRTKYFADEYFRDKAFKQQWQIKKFSPELHSGKKEHAAWNDAYAHMRIVSEAMLEELLLNKPERDKKWAIFIGLLVLLSAALWGFNEIVHWEWLAQHPKRLAIYISMQCTLLIGSCVLVTEEKKTQFLEIAGMVISSFISLAAMFA